MGLHNVGELQPQPYLAQPEGDLIGTELPIGELHVEEPVIEVSGGWSLVIEEKLPTRVLAEDAVLDSELVVLQRDFLHAGQRYRLELLSQLTLPVVPEDDAVPVEDAVQCLLNFIHDDSAQ